MKKSNVILTTLVVGGIAIWAFTYAATTGNTFTGTNSPFQWMMKMHKLGTWNFTWMRWWYAMKWMWWIMWYIDYQSLTQAQKDELNKIMQDHKTQMNELFKKYQNSTWSSAQMESDLKTLWTDHMNSIRKFVPQDKQADFDKIVAQGPQLKMFKGIWVWSWMQFRWNPLQGYIDYNSLTQQQKAEYDSIISGHMAKNKALMEQFRQQSNNLWKEDMNALKKFVPQDKQAEFDTFLNQGPQMNKWFGKWWKMKGHGRGAFWKEPFQSQTWTSM